MLVRSIHVIPVYCREAFGKCVCPVWESYLIWKCACVAWKAWPCVAVVLKCVQVHKHVPWPPCWVSIIPAWCPCEHAPVAWVGFPSLSLFLFYFSLFSVPKDLNLSRTAQRPDYAQCPEMKVKVWVWGGVKWWFSSCGKGESSPRLFSV